MLQHTAMFTKYSNDKTAHFMLVYRIRNLCAAVSPPSLPLLQPYNDGVTADIIIVLSGPRVLNLEVVCGITMLQPPSLHQRALLRPYGDSEAAL